MRRSRVKLIWIVLLAFYAVPYVVLFTTGTLWLWEHGWLMTFALATCVLMLVGWPMLRWLRRHRRPGASPGALGRRVRLLHEAREPLREPRVLARERREDDHPERHARVLGRDLRIPRSAAPRADELAPGCHHLRQPEWRAPRLMEPPQAAGCRARRLPNPSAYCRVSSAPKKKICAE